MAMPPGIGAIDTMIGFPSGNMKEVYAFITRQTKDRQSKEEFAFPAEYMFKQVPEKDIDTDDPISFTLNEMDRWGVEKGSSVSGGKTGWVIWRSSVIPTGSFPLPVVTPTLVWTAYGN
jgi:hypothetical protein